MTPRDPLIAVVLDCANATASAATRTFLRLREQAPNLGSSDIADQATQALEAREQADREVRVLAIGDMHASMDVERIRQALEASSVNGAHVSVLTGAPRPRHRTLVVDEAFLLQRQLAEAIKSLEAPRLQLCAAEAENKPWYRQHAQRGRRRAY